MARFPGPQIPRFEMNRLCGQIDIVSNSFLRAQTTFNHGVDGGLQMICNTLNEGLIQQANQATCRSVIFALRIEDIGKDGLTLNVV